jgi:hypothetical protein
MLGNLLDTLTIDPDFASVIQAFKKLGSGVRQGHGESPKKMVMMFGWPPLGQPFVTIKVLRLSGKAARLGADRPC